MSVPPLLERLIHFGLVKCQRDMLVSTAARRYRMADGSIVSRRYVLLR